jgi:hypothetical protein
VTAEARRYIDDRDAGLKSLRSTKFSRTARAAGGCTAPVAFDTEYSHYSYCNKAIHTDSEFNLPFNANANKNEASFNIADHRIVILIT